MLKKVERRLVNKLISAGYESPYLDRLRRCVGAQATQDALEAEIAQEIAGALGRAGAKVDLLLLKLQLARDAHDEADGSERSRLADEYAALRQQALTARWELQVHREAVGMRGSHRSLDETYPIPPPLHGKSAASG